MKRSVFAWLPQREPPVRYIQQRNIWQQLHIDLPLFIGLLLLAGISFGVLYSAGNQQMNLLMLQGGHFVLAFTLMFILAQIPATHYKTWAPWLFTAGLLLLVAVLVMGKIGKGAQRWLDLGALRFQPSEIAKLAVPMMLAWYYHDRHLPPSLREIFVSALLMIVPVLLTAKQPDLGTALVIAAAGGSVILLAGISWWLLAFLLGGLAAITPVIWHFMHEFQRERVLTFLDPERDPLGSGYHIIQSKIAIGSGGLFGKGWLHGSQSHLHFLPEHTTDFIFAVVGEEFGLLGCLFIIALYLFIIARCLYISSQAQDTFTRLLAGSISVTFALCVFVNIGMVSGVLPVVGMPLPLMSYGGTAKVTAIIGFGILMSIHTHRRLLAGK